MSPTGDNHPEQSEPVAQGTDAIRDFEARGMWANLGARLLEMEVGRVVVEGRLTFEAHGFPSARGPIVHGGALAALADCALASAGASMARAGQAAATSDLQVDFYRAATPGRFIARAEVRHRSRRLAYCQASIEQEDGTVVAEARAVMAYMEPRT